MTIPGCINYKNVQYELLLTQGITHIQNQFVNIFKLPDLYKLELFKLYYKIENKQVPNYFTTVINPLTHHYNTRRQAIQQLKTIHAFAQHNCIFSMIYLINKSPIIRLQVTTYLCKTHPQTTYSTAHTYIPQTAYWTFGCLPREWCLY